MSTENQAENAVSEEKNAAPKEQSEKPAKTAPPKPSKPKSSVIQIHPEGERIHPKKAEGRFAKLRIAAVLATRQYSSIFRTGISSFSGCRWAWVI